MTNEIRQRPSRQGNRRRPAKRLVYEYYMVHPAFVHFRFMRFSHEKTTLHRCVYPNYDISVAIRKNIFRGEKCSIKK